MAVRIAVSVACATLLLAAPAAATLPGANGRIAFGILEENYGGSDEEEWFVAAYRLGLMSETGRNRRLIARGLGSAFSPDGRRLAVASEVRWGIVIHRLDGRPVRRVTFSDDEDPTWSPSGERLAFTRERCERPGGDTVCFARVYTIGSDGTDRRLLAENARDPDWSARGEIAYFSEATGSVVVNDPTRGTARVVAARANSPSWSPDGDRLAFVARRGTELRTVGADGERPQTVFRARGEVSGPVWSPDGERLAAITRWGVITMALDGADRVRLLPVGWCPFCTADANSVQTLSWQPLPRR
jgi:hypothetical protein